MRVGDVLQDQVRAMGWERRLREEEVLVRWEEAVGPQIAARSRPSHLMQGRLTVVVDSPVWAQQLSLLKRELLRRLTRRFGPGLVTELYFVAGRVASPPARQGPVDAAAQALPELPAALEEELAAVPDGDLRASLRRIGRAALARHGAGGAATGSGEDRRPRSPSGSR